MTSGDSLLLEWFVALVVLVGLYFAVRNFMRARR
jgi:hypothetical protein